MSTKIRSEKDRCSGAQRRREQSYLYEVVVERTYCYLSSFFKHYSEEIRMN